MTEIIWTNCADEMPPNDEIRVIMWIYDGCFVYAGNWFTKYERTLIADQAKWTLYTDEKWEELNK
jgi:hypothetical protein